MTIKVPIKLYKDILMDLASRTGTIFRTVVQELYSSEGKGQDSKA